VAYLTHSQYGRNGNEIAKNNSSKKYTGRSLGKPSTVDRDYTEKGTCKYNEKEKVTVAKEGTGESVSVRVTNDATNAWSNTAGVWSSNINGQSNGSTILSMEFTLATTGVLNFEYSVSSQSTQDIMSYTIQKEGTTILEGEKISGTSRGTIEETLKYEEKAHILEAGNYTILFQYKKNRTVNLGLDKGYVRNVEVLDGIETREEVIGEGGVLAATTGNIYGIYDLSGSGAELVAAWNAEVENTYNSIRLYGEGVTNENGESTKYVTAYHNASTTSKPSNTTCILGDATYEVPSWFSDAETCVTTTRPFFSRGAAYGNSTAAGVFAVQNTEGMNSGGNTFRIVLPRSLIAKQRKSYVVQEIVLCSFL